MKKKFAIAMLRMDFVDTYVRKTFYLLDLDGIQNM